MMPEDITLIVHYYTAKLIRRRQIQCEKMIPSVVLESTVKGCS